MKRFLIVAFSIAAVIALLGGATLAYFTHEDVAKNYISAGKVDFVIHENTSEGGLFPAEGIEIMPGDKVSKIVTVENTSNHPIYFRVKLVKAVSDDQLSADILSVDINNDDWTLKDGYYYYNIAIQPGQKTTPLFTEVDVNGLGMGNEYLGKSFTLNVEGYAVQSENNGTDVFSAIGWPKAAEKN